ncbi:hypothetical protein RFI_24874 [Reticulomyxa filosa]|uniref:Uncharacterized protein n=1 Tax=Reticulomyxa filosa TaxID=46433 RepID=X6MHG4_RETFI|nr:hypothetical protein RFI_24874 [Reticulomyxa filosa]|eukprot:ETO12500.1 hypothetical protein RFI_24874 [Reticulomyxa filosa]
MSSTSNLQASVNGVGTMGRPPQSPLQTNIMSSANSNTRSHSSSSQSSPTHFLSSQVELINFFLRCVYIWMINIPGRKREGGGKCNEGLLVMESSTSKTNEEVARLSQELETARLENAKLQGMLSASQQKQEQLQLLQVLLADKAKVQDHAMGEATKANTSIKERVHVKHEEKEKRQQQRQEEEIEEEEEGDDDDDNDNNEDENNNDKRENANANSRDDNDKQSSTAKLIEMINVMEEEVKILKKELLKKETELKYIQKQAHPPQEANVYAKIEELEKEVDSLRMQVWEERSKNRQVTKEYLDSKYEMEKEREKLKTSNLRMRAKLRTLRDEVQTKTAQIDLLRQRICKQAAYQSSPRLTRTLSKGEVTDPRRSRSKTNKHITSSVSSTFNYKKRFNGYNCHKKKKKLANERQSKIEQARNNRNTFGHTGNENHSPATSCRRTKPSAAIEQKSKSKSKSRQLSESSLNKPPLQSEIEQTFLKKNQSGPLLNTTPKEETETKSEALSVLKTSKEIQSIDARLNALQTFLRAVKSKTSLE